MGIVNGIKSCMSAVGDAVKGVADKIKSFLHFSVPDEGPLSDADEYMPDFMKLLPLEKPETQENAPPRRCDTLYEHPAEEVFAAIVPEYLGGVLYGALCESRASEQAARRSAMDSATQNADEMIADLSLKFNRARQAAITQEITEIVAGS